MTHEEQLALCIEELDDAQETLARLSQAFCEVPRDVTVDDFLDAFCDRFDLGRPAALDTVHRLEKLTGRTLRR